MSLEPPDLWDFEDFDDEVNEFFSTVDSIGLDAPSPEPTTSTSAPGLPTSIARLSSVTPVPESPTPTMDSPVMRHLFELGPPSSEPRSRTVPALVRLHRVEVLKRKRSRLDRELSPTLSVDDSETLADDSVEERLTVPPATPPPSKRRANGMRRDECQSCCLDVPANQFPKTPHKKATSSCRACLSCWSKHLHSQLEDAKWDQLSCVGCATILEESDIKTISNRFKRKDRVEPKMQEKATMDFLRSMPDFVPCPSSTCKDGAFMADGNLFTCQTCKFRYCFDCNVPFHEGERCQEFLDRTKEDRRKTLEIAQSLETLKSTTKACPKCKSPIEKNNGCDHMSCTKCRYQFCWICLADWKKIMKTGNRMHGEKCTHYRYP